MDTLSDIFIKILNMSITASYVIAAVLLLRLCMRKLPKIYSYCIWAIAGFRLLCPFSISSAFSLFNLKLFRTVASGERQSMAYIPENIGYQAIPQVNTGITSVNQAVNSSLPPATLTGSVNPMQIILYIGARIWLLGITVLFLYMLVSYVKLRKQVKCAVFFSDKTKILAARVYECDNIRTPFVLGIFRPRIYIPFHLSEREREYILAHESYHIRRHDPVMKLAAFILALFYWFHPLVWVSFFLMGRDMEMSCDEKVLKDLGNEIKQDYSLSLLSFAFNKRLHLLGPLAFGEGFAGTRVRNVLHYKKPALWICILGTSLVTTVSTICITDRKDENVLRVEKTEAEDSAGFAAACEYSFEPDISSYLIYAEIYDGGNYAGQLNIAEGDLTDSNRAGESILTMTPSGKGEEGFDTLSIGYSAGAVSDFVSISLNRSAIGFSWAGGLKNKHAPSYKMQPDKSYVIAAGYFENDNGGRVRSYTPSTLTEMGMSGEDFAVLLSENDISVLVYMVISEKSSGELKEMYRDVPLQWMAENETNAESDNKPGLSKIMVRVFDNCWDTDRVLAFDEPFELSDEDYMIRLAETDDGQYSAYGCYSQEYGCTGIYMIYHIGGDDHVNFLEESWMSFGGSNAPRLQAYDFNEDGHDEVAFVFPWGGGTGCYVEKLVIFQTYKGGHMKPREFTGELQQKEIARLLDIRVHEEKMKVDILSRENNEVLVAGISYDLEHNAQGKFQNFSYSEQVRFVLDDDIYMLTDVGILTDKSVMPEYMGDIISYQVEYSWAKEGLFTLKEPVYTQEAVLPQYGKTFIVRPLGIEMSLPEKDNWIQLTGYQFLEDGIVRVTYYDKIQKADITLNMGKADIRELSGFGEAFEDFENGKEEYWKAFHQETGNKILIEVQAAPAEKEIQNVLVSWTDGDINYALSAAVPEGADISPMAKTAVYIAENTKALQ